MGLLNPRPGGGGGGGGGGGAVSSILQRRESITLQGIATAITGVTPSAAILSAATDPITVEYQGSGGTDAELISNTGRRIGYNFFE